MKGDAGAQGVAGAKGDTGTQGDAGVKGDTGATGASGISAVKYVTLPFERLEIITTGASTTQTFFTADTTGNYTFQVIVVGVANPLNDFKLKAEIVIGNSRIPSQIAIASNAYSYANGIPGWQYGFTVIGAAANVAVGTVFNLRISNQLAVSEGTPIDFIGSALIDKVGSIG